LVNIKIN